MADIALLLRTNTISCTLQSKYCKPNMILFTKNWLCFGYIFIVKYSVSSYCLRLELQWRRECKILNQTRIFPMRGIIEKQNKNIQTCASNKSTQK